MLSSALTCWTLGPARSGSAVGWDGYGRFSVRSGSVERIVSPHLVAATLKFGPVPVGSTLMHDCDVRICAATGPGHVRMATQGGEHAAGRAAGESSGSAARPGRRSRQTWVPRVQFRRLCAPRSLPAVRWPSWPMYWRPGRRRSTARSGRLVRSAAERADPPIPGQDVPVDLLELAARTIPTPRGGKSRLGRSSICPAEPSRRSTGRAAAGLSGRVGRRWGP